jgi:hypothetical protein
MKNRLWIASMYTFLVMAAFVSTAWKSMESEFIPETESDAPVPVLQSVNAYEKCLSALVIPGDLELLPPKTRHAKVSPLPMPTGDGKQLQKSTKGTNLNHFFQHIPDSLMIITGLKYNDRLTVQSLSGVKQTSTGLIASKGFKFMSAWDRNGWMLDSLIYLAPVNYSNRSFDVRALTSQKADAIKLSTSQDALMFTCKGRGATYQRPIVRKGSQLTCPGGCRLTKLTKQEALKGQKKSLIIIPNYR